MLRKIRKLNDNCTMYHFSKISGRELQRILLIELPINHGQFSGLIGYLQPPVKRFSDKLFTWFFENLDMFLIGLLTRYSSVKGKESQSWNMLKQLVS